MPGYTLVDLFTSYKFDERIWSSASSATNLFDVDYTPALDPICRPSTAATPANCFGSNVPAAATTLGRGRTVLFTAKAHF